MKGHVGGGPGFLRLSGVGVQIKLGRSYMSRYIPLEYIVQEWLLKMSGSVWAYSAWIESDIKLESLILAQNERWRHA